MWNMLTNGPIRSNAVLNIAVARYGWSLGKRETGSTSDLPLSS